MVDSHILAFFALCNVQVQKCCNQRELSSQYVVPSFDSPQECSFFPFLYSYTLFICLFHSQHCLNLPTIFNSWKNKLLFWYIKLGKFLIWDMSFAVLQKYIWIIIFINSRYVNWKEYFKNKNTPFSINFSKKDKQKLRKK